MYLAAESWRRAYGQVATTVNTAERSTLQFQLPGGGRVSLPGWIQMTRGNTTIFVGPEGDEFSSLEHAREAMRLQNEGQRNTAGDD